MTSALKGNPGFQMQPHLNFFFTFFSEFDLSSPNHLKEAQSILPSSSLQNTCAASPPLILSSTKELNHHGYSFKVSNVPITSRADRSSGEFIMRSNSSLSPSQIHSDDLQLLFLVSNYSYASLPYFRLMFLCSWYFEKKDSRIITLQPPSLCHISYV